MSLIAKNIEEPKRFTHEGYIQMSVGNANAFVKVFCALYGRCLYIYPTKERYEEEKLKSPIRPPPRTVSLEGKEILVLTQPVNGHKFLFVAKVLSKSDDAKVASENAPDILFKAGTEEQRKSWVKALATCMLLSGTN